MKSARYGTISNRNSFFFSKHFIKFSWPNFDLKSNMASGILGF